MIMKKFLVSMAAVFCVMTAMAADPVKTYGQLQVKGAQLCDQQGNTVVLRGVSLGWHNLWPRFYNKKAVKWLKEDWHPTVIRAAIGASSVDDHYGENPQFAFDCLYPVVDGAIKQGLYIIVDWHSHTLQKEEAVKFFGQVAQKYGKHPNIIYELFRFVSPALYATEKKNAVLLVGSGYVMFLLGTALNYLLIFPLTVKFLGTYQVSPEVANMLTLQSYVDTLLMMSLMMGVIFELPVVSCLLGRMGLLTADMMQKWRRHAIVAILLVSAIITPTTDAFTLIVVALPIWLLYEVSILLVRIAR